MRSLFYSTIISLSLVALLFLPTLAKADTIGLSPSSGEYAVGKIFSVNVYVSSVNQAVNAVSGTVSFPADKLQVVSVSKAGSILTLWVTDPTFSNSVGTVDFEGVAPNPGFQGSFGRVMTISFRVVASGNAPVKFSSASVLANDGNGTNILRNTNSGSFTLVESATVVPPPAPVSPPIDASTGPRAPIVSSKEFVDQKIWYALIKGTFSWKVPNDVTSSRTSVTKEPVSSPSELNTPAIDSKEVSDIKDGTWYFNAQLKNKNGWGAVAHYSFKIDSTAPETFDIKQISSTELTDPQARFSFKSSDATSGINHYVVQIDSLSPINWTDDGSHVFTSSILKPGIHILVAKAVDEAGNFATASINFSIQGIESPVITSFTESVSENTPLVVKGTAPLGDKVEIIIKKVDSDPISQIVSVNEQGVFEETFDTHALESGAYTLTVISIDSRGAQSLPTDEKKFSVNTNWFNKFAKKIVGILSVLIPIIALLFFIVYIVLYGLNKINALKYKINKDVREVELEVNKDFTHLKSEAEKSIKLLEETKINRKLTREEKIIITNLSYDLSKSEKDITKKLADIKKDVE
ncbi:hypothetical protein BH11PAT3_BH11PAT3_3320 [soil metagenome]